MSKRPDIIIIGAGPAGIFTAYELIKLHKNINILIIEKGSSIHKRVCPKRKLNKCVGCNPCHITTGFAGAGAFSDGKLSLSTSVGGNLPQIIGDKQCAELIKYCDNIYLEFGADKKIHGISNDERIQKIRKLAIQSNLKLIDCPIRHLGTEGGYEIYSKLQDYLIEKGVEIKFNVMVKDIIVSDGKILGVKILDNGFENEILCDKVISAIGREGSQWFENICQKHSVEKEVGIIDIGVRVEVSDEIMEEINSCLYEGKLVYYTETFDDKVRVFCSNPSGEVSTEYYDNGLAVVNGHAYKSSELKTKNTNFALLVSKHFTEPFNSPIEYGKHIAKLGNMLSGGKIMVQRFGDFKRGRRTIEERLVRNNIEPTLVDAVPGDLSLVLPYRIMKDLEEMLYALDKVSPGVASDETLLYGVEVKFYSNRVTVNKSFETNIKGLYAIGDGSGITRGLMMASCNGVAVAREVSI